MFDRQDSYLRQAAIEATAAAKEAKQEAKEAAAEAKKEAAAAATVARQEAAKAAIRMQDFLVNMIQMMLATKNSPQIKRKRETTSCRPTQEQQRMLSPMWQASRKAQSPYIPTGNDMKSYMEEEDNQSNNSPPHETGTVTYESDDPEFDNLENNNNIEDDEDYISDDDANSHKLSTTPTSDTPNQQHNPPNRYDKSRSRTRSPGSTPKDSLKLQRTGRAPTKPSSQDQTAQALNFEGMQIDSETSLKKAPDPCPGDPSQQ